MELSFGELTITQSCLLMLGGFILIYLGTRLDWFLISIWIAIFGGYLTGSGTLQLIPRSILIRINPPDWLSYIYWLFWLSVTLTLYIKLKLKRIAEIN